MAATHSPRQTAALRANFFPLSERNVRSGTDAACRSSKMSLFSRILEDTEWDLRRAEREMQRQVRLLDRHLRHLREELPLCCPCSPLPPPPCPCLRPRGTSSHPAERGRALPATEDMEQELVR